jgi:hypothetical protein
MNIKKVKNFSLILIDKNKFEINHFCDVLKSFKQDCDHNIETLNNFLEQNPKFTLDKVNLQQLIAFNETRRDGIENLIKRYQEEDMKYLDLYKNKIETEFGGIEE